MLCQYLLSKGLPSEDADGCISHEVTGPMRVMISPCLQGAEPSSRAPPRQIMTPRAPPSSWTGQARRTAPWMAASRSPGAATPAHTAPS